MSYLWEGVVGRFSNLGNGVSRALRLTTKGSLAVAQAEPAGTEMLRSHSRFVGGCQVIANGIAPVSAVPTTSPSLCLYNSASAGGKSLVVDSISFALGSGTAAAGATLLAAVSPGALAAAPSAGTNWTAKSASGSTTASVALLATTSTLPGAPCWVPLAASLQLAAANVGQGGPVASLPGGGFLVPPTYGLGIAILSGSGTSPLYLVGLSWTEIVLDVE